MTFNADIRERKTFRLTPISPVLIQGGDGSDNYGQSFARVPGDNKFIYLVDQAKLRGHLLALDNGGLAKINEFVTWISQRENEKKGITEFLSHIRFDFKNIKEITKVKVYARKKGQYDYFFIRNGMNKPYIPGSSIKGVIKTAVLWKILKGIKEKEPAKFESILTKIIKKNIKAYTCKTMKKENFVAELTNDIFQNFNLNEKAHKDQKVDLRNPFTDLFRVLQVTDSTAIVDTFIQRERPWNVLSLHKSGNPYFKMRNPKSIEAYSWNDHDPNSPVTFDIMLDTHLLAVFQDVGKESPTVGDFKIPFQDISGLMKIVDEFSRAIWQYLSEFYANVPVIPYEPPDPTELYQGIVCDYQNGKNFGFIMYQRKRVFFHKSAVKQEELASLRDGVTVRFQIGTGPKGPAASNVAIDNTEKEKTVDISKIAGFYRQIPEPLIMKIGWGTGLLGTTFSLLLQDGKLKNELVTLRDKVISNDGTPHHGNFVPKSARVVCDDRNQPEYPLGWVALEEVKNGL